MDQATQATTTTAPTFAGDETFAHAGAVAAGVVDHLTPNARPSSVRIEPSLPSGWAVTILFLSHHAAGLYEVAATIDAPITRATHGEEIHLETYARVLEVDLRAAVLVTATQAAVLDGLAAPAEPTPGPADSAPAAPVPLRDSVPVVAPAASAGDGADDVARCVRCGCTDAAACEGGCYWVPNTLFVDLCSACATPEELKVMTYTAEVSDGAL